MGLEAQEFPSDADSDITLVACSGTNNNDLTYLGSRENSPENHDTAMDLSAITKEVGNLHEVVIKELAKINSPRKLFTPGQKIHPTNLAGEERNTHQNSPEIWRDAAATHLTALSICNSGRRPRYPGLTSAAPLQRLERRHLPSDWEWPPQRLPHGCLWQALCSLPVLGAP